MTLAFILLGIVSRLLPHPPNFAPITALALFGGVTFRKREALIIPLLTMLISDLLISGYYGPEMFYVYGSFFLIGLIGLLLRGHKTPPAILISTLFSSVLFFTVTNFGVWATGWYPRNLNGLVDCYTAAIPFFRNTLAGDLFYTTVFFGGYALANQLYQRLAVSPHG